MLPSAHERDGQPEPLFFGLATSVRLHVATTVAGTNIKESSQTSTGLFAAASIGLTFEIDGEIETG